MSRSRVRRPPTYRHPLGLALLVFALFTLDRGPAAAQPGAAEPATTATGPASEPPRDLLTLAEGAVVVSASANAPAAPSLTDGSAETAWHNQTPREAAPYRFVFELRAPTRLRQVGVAGAGPRPGGVAGGSARRVRIEASAQGPEDGYIVLGTVEAAEQGETLLDVAPERDIRWLRFTIEGNHAGRGGWTYLGEAIAYGDQTPPADAARFGGVFDLGRGAILVLRMDGSAVTGCYTESGGHAAGTITGEVSEGVARVSWRRDGRGQVHGVALLVIDSRGHLNGVRYRQRSRSVWSGAPASAGTAPPCGTMAEPAANPVAAELEAQGEVRLYGILFDFDQATLRPESEAALRQVLAALNARPALTADIEGHTDSAGATGYNQALSQRRAETVVAWLVAHGVAAERLRALGKGESEPVAGNDTAEGRALNRRVEIRRR